MRSTFGGIGQIETAGLVRYFDASNTNSYAGSGNIWNDLGKNTATSTLTGSGVLPTYNTSNGGALTFASESLQFSSLGTLNLGNTLTICAWIKPRTVAAGIGSRNVYGTNANGNDNWFGHYTSQVELLATQTANTGNFTLRGGTMSSTSWNFIAGTVNVDTLKVYLNGEEVGSLTPTFPSPGNPFFGAWNSTVNSIGRRGSLVDYSYNGDIARVWIYDRVLSLDSIRQNYNTTKGRYGL